MPDDGFGLDPAALEAVIAGHEKTVRALSDLIPGGGYVADAGSAAGLHSMAFSAGDLGEHSEVQNALAFFCLRWEHGLGSLLRTGQELADQLTDVLKEYRGQDDEISGLFKEILMTVVSPDQQKVAGAREMSWGELAQAGRPDYGGWGEEFGEVGESVGQAADDAWTAGVTGSRLLTPGLPQEGDR
ncbi:MULTISPECIES: hypothetical protein [unclassified Saccharopolyspora]|uniref:hypothetical protein n=1 Tax=unclassified Saccharopolyspora TaxID=2646250 RepID=UPI001CD269FE|nr:MULTISPECIES: hypothetical protein [unclassified Saccharopolyspora]MCA1188885.1 hypothetical protein [Saccharopolyspora sp. 6T]MCA1195452.1 hypothetical protein [Saccharopolyspora sp. 6V]MCA1227296.1 hypothetical protein [Saccharopolyspora sp. 6M]MCA1279818.1 hypothetical protein [Saccharopolyspora sp. 7B]